jgi:hypothetical protein
MTSYSCMANETHSHMSIGSDGEDVARVKNHELCHKKMLSVDLTTE